MLDFLATYWAEIYGIIGMLVASVIFFFVLDEEPGENPCFEGVIVCCIIVGALWPGFLIFCLIKSIRS